MSENDVPTNQSPNNKSASLSDFKSSLEFDLKQKVESNLTNIKDPKSLQLKLT